jgi:hypothetical protein
MKPEQVPGHPSQVPIDGQPPTGALTRIRCTAWNTLARKPATTNPRA